jgi:hypothetical protein
MNPTLVDILILFSFVPIWFLIFDAYERWNDPKARRRRQRKARRKELQKTLEKQGRFIQ